jgi:threonine synthase
MSSGYLQCVEAGCQRRQDSDRTFAGHLCSFCGGLLEVRYDFPDTEPEATRRLWRERRSSNRELDRSGVWRFRELLPFLREDAEVISLSEGSTPLVETPRTGKWAGGIRLRIKHLGSNPTGSFKDLGMTTCISHAVDLGVPAVACASTGNTAASMAAYAARAGMLALVFVPQDRIAVAKLAQALDFGAVAVEVGENFDTSFRLLREVAPGLRLYLANSINPYRIEGQKTVVPEMLEQSGWEAPDFVALPGGNLGNTSAIGKGLRELKQLGLIDKVPRLVVVQAEGANPFFQMMVQGSSALDPVPDPQTEATAIRIGAPASWPKAKPVLEWTNGICESVTDEEILEAKMALAEDGVGCEPASAAPVAGLRKLSQAGKIKPGANAIAVLTGHQLKDADYILRHRVEAGSSQQRLQIEPNVEAVRATLHALLEKHTGR